MRRKNKVTYLGFIIMILLLGIGYAALQTNLNITGTTVLKDNRWDIHLENVSVNNESVSASTPTINTNKDTVSYSVTLNKPGDFYEFTVDAKNDGSIDGMISSISSKLNGEEITNLPTALSYELTYSDGIEIAQNHLLEAGEKETYKLKLAYRTDITASDLPSTETSLNFSFSVTYVQADANATEKPVPLFADDSWVTIVSNVQNNTIPSYYTVGSTKEVDMGTLGTHTLRIANTTTPTECSTTGYSQTACGFVLEFADIITTYGMNSTRTNVGGWSASAMRTYVNTDIYNALPTELKNGITDTTVVSGHGSTAGETNFTSIDKLYLLSTHEVWEDVDENTNSGPDYNDTAYENTRQLDYYAGLNVTTSSYSGAIKKRNGTNSIWWLRSAYSSNTSGFNLVSNSGGWYYGIAEGTTGVSPAFRIG